MPATKRPRRGQPHKVLHLSTYDRLENYLRAFAAGHFHLLIVVGAGGLAKSRSVRAVLDDQACWIEGNATPFGMYIKLYRHRDQFVVIIGMNRVLRMFHPLIPIRSPLQSPSPHCFALRIGSNRDRLLSKEGCHATQP